MVQSLVANQDISTGEFTPTPLHTELSQLDDSTIITSADSNDTDSFRVALSDGTPPGAGTKTFRVRWRKSASGGHTVSPTMTLFEGTTEIATVSVMDIGETFVTTETTTFAEVTDWANLEVQSGGSLGSGGNPNSRRSLQVAWIEIEVPDTPEIFGSVSMAATSSLTSTNGFIAESVRPVSDNSITGWTNESGGSTDLYQSLDDELDSTYIESTTIGDSAEFALGVSGAPDSDDNHSIRIRVGVV